MSLLGSIGDSISDFFHEETSYERGFSDGLELAEEDQESADYDEGLKDGYFSFFSE